MPLRQHHLHGDDDDDEPGDVTAGDEHDGGDDQDDDEDGSRGVFAATAAKHAETAGDNGKHAGNEQDGKAGEKHGKRRKPLLIDLEGIEGGPVRGVFIRAPWVEETGDGVEVLAEVNGHPVAVRHDNVTAISFHPELTGDDREIAKDFLKMLAKRNAAKKD